MTFPYENRTDCEVEQWIECIENSGTVKWDQLHCDDLKKLFEDPRVPPTPPPNTKPPVAGAELTPSPTPTDYCAGGAMRSPDYDEICGTGEGEEEEKPLPEIGEDTSEDTANDEDTGDDQPRFGGDQFFDDSDDSDNNGNDNSDSEEDSDSEADQPQPQFG